MRRRLVISSLPGEIRAALLVDGRLESLTIERADRPSRLGNLYHGRVAKVDKALDAAFVEIGEAQPGFLPLSEAPKGLSEGDGLAVRVLREAAGDKGLRLSGRIKDPPGWLPERLKQGAPPVLLLKGDDLMSRLSAMAQDLDEVVCDDAAFLRETGRRLAEAKRAVPPELHHDPAPRSLFEREGVEAELEALLAPQVLLPSGGHLLIEPVVTLTAIDVNSGQHPGGRAQDRDLAVNLEAAREIARQVRLRALSGLLVVDFLAMKSAEHRRDVVAALKAALRDDPEPVRVFPMTPSGLVEMTRRRARPALHEILTKPCGIAEGGRIKDPTTLAFDLLRGLSAEAAVASGRRLTVAAAPEVAAALRGPASAALQAFLSKTGCNVEIVEAAIAPGEPAKISVA